MANKWLQAFDKLETVVDLEISNNIYNEGVRTPSPSVNFIFGNTHLIPFGSSVILWGPPKGGKSLISNMMIGQLHKDFPEAIALKFNTELREKFQMTGKSLKMFGIDPERYRAFDTNKAEDIFDVIEKDVALMCEKGAPIKLIIIDSVTDIIGRRTANADTVLTQQMGDDAATVGTGLKRIKSTLRKYGITLVLIAQERAQLDPVEIMRGKKTKMAGAYYLQHFAEYFVHVSRNESKEGKTDELGNKLQNDEDVDVMGNIENVAHKIKFVMNDSSVGVSRRAGELTFHKHMGLINVHEEVFRLGVARNIFDRPNNRTYILPNWPDSGRETKFSSKEECLTFLKGHDEMREEILRRVREKDIELFKNGLEDIAWDASTSSTSENEDMDEDQS